MSVTLYPCMLCVALPMYLPVLCAACLTVSVKSGEIIRNVFGCSFTCYVFGKESAAAMHLAPPRYVVSNGCNEPTSCVVQHIGAHCCEVMYFGGFGFRGVLDFLNCDDVCMCAANKQFEHLEFVSESVYVD